MERKIYNVCIKNHEIGIDYIEEILRPECVADRIQLSLVKQAHLPSCKINALAVVQTQGADPAEGTKADKHAWLSTGLL